MRGKQCRGIHLQPVGCMQPRMAMNTAQHKIVNLLKIFFAYQFMLVFVYLMCGSRQLFFQYGYDQIDIVTKMLAAVYKMVEI